MKVLPLEKVREADKYTIENEPVDSIELMERAARAAFKWIYKKLKRGDRVKIFAGLGNNGGDGLVIARQLARQNIPVDVYVIRYSDKTTDDFKINYDRIKKMPEVRLVEIKEISQMPDLKETDIVLDAIFGSGLSKPVTGFIAEVIHAINASKSIVIAIDTPSGLYVDTSSIGHKDNIIKADYTLSFQFPKFAFFSSENEEFVGEWEVIPIGLHPDFIRDVKITNYYVDEDEIRRVLHQRSKFSHKGSFGHALLISGSKGKMGAATMASKAALRSGLGLLTTHVPKCGVNILQTSAMEAMASIDENDAVFSAHPDLDMYNAIGIGPGLGTDEITQKAFKILIQNAGMPMVIDADAINILAENKTWISFLPPNSIITPHPKEFERIAGKASNGFDRMELQREFSLKNLVYVVLKGAYTSTSCPDGTCYFNSTGNPGMATAGSGDVLTGIILGLLAQAYTPFEAAITGVFLHGLAGDHAANRLSQPAMIAGDIIDYIPNAYKVLLKL
ncbi:NAD(P)H-hydrate dehydratase [Bacteroidota bacterium]